MAETDTPPPTRPAEGTPAPEFELPSQTGDGTASKSVPVSTVRRPACGGPR